MSRRLWLLRGWLSGWWLEKRCAWGGHKFVHYSVPSSVWRCKCRLREQTNFEWLQELTRS